MRLFTLVSKRTPPGTGKPELHNFFSQFGPLAGEGIRFSAQRNNPKFLIDFKVFSNAKKALQTLNKKTHPEYPVFKWDLEWSPITKKEITETIAKSKAAKEAQMRAQAAAAAQAEDDARSDNTDDLFGDSDSDSPAKKPPPTPTPSAAPSSNASAANRTTKKPSGPQSSTFSLADVLDSKKRKRQSASAAEDDQATANTDSGLDTLTATLESVAEIFNQANTSLKTSNRYTLPPANETTKQLQHELFATIESFYSVWESSDGKSITMEDMKSNISIPCMRIPTIQLPFM